MKTLELKEFSEDLLKETEALTSGKERLETIKSMLEQKNKELESSLKKLSAWRLAVIKQMANRRVKQEFTGTEQGAEKSSEVK